MLKRLRVQAPTGRYIPAQSGEAKRAPQMFGSRSASRVKAAGERFLLDVSPQRWVTTSERNGAQKFKRPRVQAPRGRYIPAWGASPRKQTTTELRAESPVYLGCTSEIYRAFNLRCMIVLPLPSKDRPFRAWQWFGAVTQGFALCIKRPTWTGIIVESTIFWLANCGRTFALDTQ